MLQLLSSSPLNTGWRQWRLGKWQSGHSHTPAAHMHKAGPVIDRQREGYRFRGASLSPSFLRASLASMSNLQQASV